MIEFRGKISEDCWRYLEKIGIRVVRIAGLLPAIVLLTIGIVAIIMWSWFFVVIALASIVFFIVAIFPKKCNVVDAPTRVTIKKNIIERDGVGAKNYASRELDAVKKVIDFGDWYYISFYFPRKDMSFVCQKDLIVEGTIEEFEQLFASRLVRAKNK